MAGASIGAVVEADIEGVATRMKGGDATSADNEGAVVIVVVVVVAAAAAAGKGRRLPHTTCEGFEATTLGADGGANEVLVDVTTGGLRGSGLVTVMTGRCTGQTPTSRPATAAFESVNRPLSFSSILASASRFSAMLSIGCTYMSLAPATIAAPSACPTNLA